ncbi:hypothetical protein AC578_3245 [Pseudocercospora eumusae]|uniref:NTF2-like domain-containing protein n=1 Tax=Pseudocercospora eumusae TaxID=321146 RepID=A0A139H215_9PEZI|nr:hypothetical protein AC578_3245 [Pseudocercospora eumusae]
MLLASSPLFTSDKKLKVDFGAIVRPDLRNEDYLSDAFTTHMDALVADKVPERFTFPNSIRKLANRVHDEPGAAERLHAEHWQRGRNVEMITNMSNRDSSELAFAKAMPPNGERMDLTSFPSFILSAIMKLTLITSLAGLGALATAIPSELFERGDYGRCISKWEAKQWINSNIAMWNRKGDWKRLAKTLYADDFKAKSNSIKSSRGFKLTDDPYYNSLNDFITDLDKKIPTIYDQSTVGYYLDCNTLVWVRNIGRVKGCDDPVRDISVLTMQRKGKKIQAKDGLIEFDSIKWGKALGGKYDPPKRQYNFGQNKGNGYGGKDYEWDPKKNDGHHTSPHQKDDGKKNGGTQVDPHKNDGNGYDGKQNDPQINNNGYGRDDKKNDGKHVDPQINNNGYGTDKSSGTQVDPHQQSGYKNDGTKSDPKSNDKYGHNDRKDY